MQDRVQDVVDAFAKLRWRRFKLLSKISQRARRTVPDRNEVVVSGEDRCLAVAYPVSVQLSRIGNDSKRGLRAALPVWP